jgi:predicted cupin superfamily sugar epimerase
MLPEVRALIDHFGLEPLPVELTLFSRTYRSQARLPAGGPYGSAILGLYCEEPLSMSLFHQLTVDEVWHFYGGDPLRLVLLYPDGSSRDVVMGGNPLAGQHVQFVVPAGVWQAGHLLPGGRYALYGCTMAPGFMSEMFTGGLKSQLLARYPDRAADIALLGIEDGHDARMPDEYSQD